MNKQEDWMPSATDGDNACAQVMHCINNTIDAYSASDLSSIRQRFGIALVSRGLEPEIFLRKIASVAKYGVFDDATEL